GLLGRMAPGAEHAKPLVPRDDREILEESRLADPGLAADERDVRADVEGASEGGPEHIELGRAPDERNVRGAVGCGLECGAGAAVDARLPRDRAAPGRAAEDLPIQLARLLLRLGAELALQEAKAGLVLLERGRPAAVAPEQVHERAMDDLLQGIQGEDALGGP